MALQQSGPISLNDLATEYDGIMPYKLSAYSEYADKAAGQQILLSDFYGLSANILILLDKTFEVYTTKTAIIPIANILAGSVDEYSNGNEPIRLIAVQSSINGTVVMVDTNIEFTSTAGIGVAASFEYIAENSISIQKIHQVTMNVVEIPAIICNPDTFDLQQGESLLLSRDLLTTNDIDQSGSVLTVLSVNGEIGGAVVLVGDTITFTSTGLAGEPAEFEYTVVNNLSVQQVGKVYINIIPLPEQEAYIYLDTSSVQGALSSFSPPTVADIFNNWPRFDGGNYFTNKESAFGDAAKWQFLTNPDRISMPQNTGSGCGFISPELLDNYTFETTLTSPDGDDDSIGVIVAFKRDGGINKILALIRTKGGQQPLKGYGLIYSENGSSDSIWVINNLNVGGVSGGFSSEQSRVKIQRQGDIITCYATNWNDTDNYQISSKIVLDLNSDARLSQFKGKQSYGYYSHSQAHSTYLDINFNGGLDASKIYDAQTNQPWEYINNEWEQLNSSIQDEIGYIRKVFNPDTNQRFIIKQAKISYLGKEVAQNTIDGNRLLSENQNVLMGDVTLGNGAGVGAQVVALYVPGKEEKNYLKGKPTLMTTSAYNSSSDLTRYNNVGVIDWFADNAIVLNITNFVGGTVVFANGIVGKITDIGDNNTASAYIYYEVTSYRLFDLTL